MSSLQTRTADHICILLKVEVSPSPLLAAAKAGSIHRG
jgi:hypothetical protein